MGRDGARVSPCDEALGMLGIASGRFLGLRVRSGPVLRTVLRRSNGPSNSEPEGAHPKHRTPNAEGPCRGPLHLERVKGMLGIASGRFLGLRVRSGPVLRTVLRRSAGPSNSEPEGAHPKHRTPNAKGPCRGPLHLERVKGIEPSYEAWEAAVLPLNYTRSGRGFCHRFRHGLRPSTTIPRSFRHRSRAWLPRLLLSVCRSCADCGAMRGPASCAC
jgi:hypothetical protein